MSGGNKIQVKVTEVTALNELVTRFRFEPVEGGLLPTFSGGAHTVVEMKDGDITRLNAYSLMSDPFDQTSYTISVRRDDAGRGGSLYMHQQVNLGDELTISYPVNLFSLDLRARKHLFLAGGIGITPFLAQIKQLSVMHGRWELHYACRNKALASYADELTEHYPNEANIYYDDQNQLIDLKVLLRGQPLGTHVYVCGPRGMIDWVRNTAADAGWPTDCVHFEEFLAPQPGKPFAVRLASSDKIVQVGEEESMLEALEREGVDVPYLCRGGACGQCETRVLDCDGNFVHRDHWLTDEEKASGKKIMPCVSRFEGKTLVVDH